VAGRCRFPRIGERFLVRLATGATNMNDPDYSNLIERCQNRLWVMYADALMDEKRRRMLLGHFIH
jgi:hypothetical protein